MQLTLKSAEYRWQPPGKGPQLPALRLRFTDDKLPDAIILAEDAQRMVTRDLPFVFLGAAFAEIVPAIGFAGATYNGFTADKKIVELAKQLAASTDDGTFTPGKIEL